MQQSYEVIRNKFPSLNAFPSLAPNHHKPNPILFNFFHLHQYLKYNQLNINLSFEMGVIFKLIKNCQENQFDPEYSQYMGYCYSFGLSFVRSAAHGQDELNLQVLLDDFLNIDDTQPCSLAYLMAHIQSLTKVLKHNKPTANGLIVERSRYMLKALLNAINKHEDNDLFASFVSLMKSSIDLKAYTDNRDVFLSLITRFVNDDYHIERRKLFKLAQLMIVNKEYELFKSIIYSLLNSTLTQKEERLSTFIYAVKFLENIPEELAELCALPIYETYTIEPVHYSVHYSLADWTSLVFDQLKQLTGKGVKLDFYIDFFVAKAIERYPLEELLQYYAMLTRVSDKLDKQAEEKRILESQKKQEGSLSDLIQSYAPEIVMTLWQMGSGYYNFLSDILQYAVNKVYRSQAETQYEYENRHCIRRFITSLGKALDLQDINSLDLNAKIDFLSINKSIQPHELLNYLNSEEQSKLLRVLAEDRHYDWKEVANLYPLQPTERSIIYNKTLPIPASLYLYVLTHESYKPLEFTKSFQLFYQRFQKANKHAARFAGENNVVDYGEFMMQNATKIFTIYDIMNDDLFLFMNKMIASSGKKIQRYFNKLDFIPPQYIDALNYLYKKYRNEVIKQPDSYYDTILLQIGQLELMFVELKAKNIEIPAYLAQFEEIAQNAQSLKEISQTLSDDLMYFYKEILEIPENNNCTAWDVSQLQLLSSLLVARKNIRNTLFCPLFDKMVTYDLRDDVQFNDFAYNTEQPDPLVKGLAFHNQTIEKILVDNQINTNQAFHYKTVKQFTYEKANTLPWLANDLYMDMTNLLKFLLSEPRPSGSGIVSTAPLPDGCGSDKSLSSDVENVGFFKPKNPIAQICNSIQVIKKQVEKKAGITQTKAIQNGTIDKHINIIAKNIPTLLNQDVSDELKKQGQQFLDNQNKLLLARVQPKKNAQVKKQFTIKQWDKNQIETFILGDYLSCCLAPDGGAFQNMVLRRADVANMMHVIIDEEIDEPVCGNWLFFAYEKNNPSDIYVVANFFEIRVGYALNAELRTAMIKELVDYTGTYCQSIGVRGFLISPLLYGLIPDFKGQYKTKELKICKVGGFFDPRKLDPNYGVTSFDYDLDLHALTLNKFYLYEPGQCVIENDVEICPTL